MARKPRVSTLETKQFADQLDELVRKKKESGITQADICKTTGLADSSMSAWLNDQASPTLEAINKLADYFNVSTDFLLGRTLIESKDVEFRAFCEYTGLSPAAVNVFRKYKLIYPDRLDAINTVMENEQFPPLLDALELYISRLNALKGPGYFGLSLDGKVKQQDAILAEYSATKSFAALISQLLFDIEREAHNGID